MKVIKRGQGVPEYSVVGSLHGDEPAGKKAISKLLERKEEFKRPVQFILANEKALREDERFLDSDLNRSFPGDPNSESHEERLAAKIFQKVKGTKTLDIHTTRSFPKPFATYSDTDDEVIDLIKSLGVEYAVKFPSEGKLIDSVEGVVVEAGLQGSEEAAENGFKVLDNFLGSQQVLGKEQDKSSPQFFEVFDRVEENWRFEAKNFSKVEKGEIYATRDGEKLKASQSFYPVLMSTTGYNGFLGYKARKKDVSQ